MKKIITYGFICIILFSVVGCNSITNEEYIENYKEYVCNLTLCDCFDNPKCACKSLP